jgi:predicted  nucleic acid-binding Zn-ribbon protein
MDSTIGRRTPASLAAVAETATESRDELEALRARVTELEAELAERTARANAAVAAAEDRLYWLDAWKLDLDAVMQRPMAQRAYRLYGQAIRVKRLLGRIRRRLSR